MTSMARTRGHWDLLGSLEKIRRVVGRQPVRFQVAPTRSILTTGITPTTWVVPFGQRHQ